MLASKYDLSITIDKNNTIIAISEEWGSIALDAGVAHMAPREAFIGKNIESYLGGDVTQMYYDALFKLVRLRREKIEREYRCDSFTHERHMLMRLIPLEDGAIEMQHKRLHEKAFAHSVTIESDSQNLQSTYEYIKRCSVCNALLFPHEAEWMAPESLSQEKALHLKVIYTVCPLCKNKNWFPSKSTS